MQARFRRFITRQFGNPSGLVGRIIGKRMEKGNVYDAQWSVSLLDIQPDDRVLEIGFGPGVSTQMAAEKASNGFVAGIDRSETMVRAASKRNAASIRAGRMELKQGDVSSLPFPAGSFDKALSLHSIYFWKDPLHCLKEIKRVLKPGGRLAITIQPTDKWIPKVDPVVMTLYYGKDIMFLFGSAGYQNIRVEAPAPQDNIFLVCILGSA